jgi:ArsR family metal-binding transcriptional regulator
LPEIAKILPKQACDICVTNLCQNFQVDFLDIEKMTFTHQSLLLQLMLAKVCSDLNNLVMSGYK